MDGQGLGLPEGGARDRHTPVLQLPVQHEQACGTLGYAGVAERTTGYSGPYVLQNRSVSTDAKGVVRNNNCAPTGKKIPGGAGTPAVLYVRYLSVNVP